ncbi:hypothetical protein F8M41_020691 [Gigaspora margarita]|uniref:Uncharacterized protein n=1 Tax=Gigaspora margarita TaxID=4874 RepID=A0A8H4AI11_GIGMA|nr:hypothetical protein F8M41_020691 [Gigaspora margarita]
MNNSSALGLPATSIKSKPPKIETCYAFLNFQSFDGSFSRHLLNFMLGLVKLILMILKLLELKMKRCYICVSTGIFGSYNVKEKCEMCYEKARKVLKKEVDGDE